MSQFAMAEFIDIPNRNSGILNPKNSAIRTVVSFRPEP